MLEYKVFKKWDKSILDKHKKVMNPPEGYHRIKVHLVFALKFDGRQEARLVADGHDEKPLFSIGLISSCADQFSSRALLPSRIDTIPTKNGRELVEI